jgi:hypothetical protein
MPICFRLLMQEMLRAFSFAPANAGNNIAARIAMIAITTNSSISVKPTIIWLAPLCPPRDRTQMTILPLFYHTFATARSISFH